MTMPPPGIPQAPPPFDAGNPLLSEQPAQLITAAMQTPAGQRLVLTIRTPSATVTVLLPGQDAKTWAAKLTETAEGMSSAGLIAANGNIPPPRPS